MAKKTAIFDGSNLNTPLDQEPGYRELVENAGIAILTDDRQGRITYFNQRLLELFGYSAKEMEELSIRHLIHPDDVDRVVRIHQDRLAGEETPQRYEFRGISKNGNALDLEVVAIELREGDKIIGSRSYIWDRTRHKQVEDQLQWELAVRTALTEISQTMLDASIPIEDVASVVMEYAQLFTESAFCQIFSVKTTPEHSLSEEFPKKTAPRNRFIAKSRQVVPGKTATDSNPGLLERALFTRRAFFKNTLSPTDFFPENSADIPLRKNILAVPVMLSDNLLGQIVLSDSSRDYQERDLQTIEQLAGIYALAVERKRTEQQIRHLALFPEQNPNPIIEIDLNGEVTYMNPVAQKCFPRLREEGVTEGTLCDVESILRKITTENASAFTRQIEYSDKIYEQKFVYLPESSLIRIFNTDITEQQQAAEETRQQEMLLLSILESTADGILAVNNEGKVIQANRRFVQMWNIPETLIGSKEDEKLLQFVLDQLEDPEKFLRKVRELYQSDAEDYDIIRFKDGRVFERYSRALKVNEQITGRVWSYRDVTNRERTIEALKRSEEKFSQLTRTATDAIINVDEAGRIMVWNQAAERIFGYSEKEALGQKVHELLVPESYLLKAQEGFDRFLSTGTGAVIGKIVEVEARRKDGSVFPVELSVSVQYSNHGWTATGIIRDISDRRHRKWENSILTHALRSVRECVSVTDMQDTILFVNDAFVNTYGYQQEELIGKQMDIVRSPNNPAELIRQILPATLSGGWQGEINNQRKDGSEFPVFLSTSVIHDDAGKPIALIGVAADISERRQLEQQFHQAQKMEAVGRLAGGVAHDFNNLLSVINGYSDLLLNKIVADEPFYREIQQIRKAGERAARLTNQLLAFSRKQVAKPVVTNINIQVSETKKMLQRLIGEDIEFVTDLAHDLGNVKIDAGQFEQILMNLAVNARDAMPEGGKLIIETKNVFLDKAYSQNHINIPQGWYVMLAVSDSGIGMAQEVQEHVFEPFYTTKERGKGTGLGLATVYGIVKQSNGFIWVYSEPGEGTTFKIYLPRVDEIAQAERKTVRQEGSLRGDETIMVVEDDEAVRRLITDMLTGYRYQVLEATNGETAMKVCTNFPHRIHALLTDVVMPRMSGVHLVEQLQQVHPEMKVLFISGYTENAIVHRGVLDPGINYLPKPFTPMGLVRKLREVLDAEAD